MFKLKKYSIIFHGLFFIIIAAVSSLYSAQNAVPILQKTDIAEGYKSCYSEISQVITTTSGEKRTLVLRTWAVNNGEKQLALYLSPSDIKGQKILMTDFGDNIWMFNPETRRTRKLGSHMKKKKVMGSDFTYEDQSGGRNVKKYTGIVLKEERINSDDCYVLELKPTKKGPSYSKVISWIGKKDYIGRRIDFYRDNESKPFKRMLCEDIRYVDGKNVPFKTIMTNLEDKTETLNIVTRIKFGVKIPGTIFQSRDLGK